MALRILGVVPNVGEKGVALKVDEKAASHLTPLHATVSEGLQKEMSLTDR